MAKTYRSDVAVVGGGIAGVVCALQLLDLGKSVAIYEREDVSRLGGSALEAFGGMFFVDSPEQRRMRIADTPERALSDWKSFAEFDKGSLRAQMWAKHLVERSTPDGRDFLRQYGVWWLPVVMWVERGQKIPGNSVPRFHLTWGSGRHLIMQLIKALRGHRHAGRLTIRCQHRVERFDWHAGRIAGCAGTIAGGEAFRGFAEATVVAAGGIGGSLAQVRARWRPVDGIDLPDEMLVGTHPGADGLAVEAAANAGASVRPVGNMWNYAAGIRHPRPAWPGHGVSLIPPKSALWTDAHGRRLLPPLVSGFDTLDLVQRVATAPRGFTWQILNRRMALTELAASGADWNPALRDRRIIRFALDMLVGNRWLVNDLTANCLDVVTASTVAELAARMNALRPDAAIDPVALQVELERFDASAVQGSADEQRQLIERLRGYRADRMRLVKPQRILDPRGGPLIAICERIVTRKSLGGVVTDLRSRALNDNDQAIPGLYAVGESAGFGGGGSHGNRALEGTFLLSSVITARRAAEAIARG